MTSNHFQLPDPGPTPPPLPMPPIPGELSPSPTSSPSPAPAKRSKTSSKVIQSMDTPPATITIPPFQSSTKPATTLTPPTKILDAQDQTSPSPPQTNNPTNDTLPQLGQLEEAVKLRHQTKPRRGPARDPLNKYTKGITLPIQDAHPSSPYELIAPETHKQWERLAENKLLAIPFENEKRTAESNEKISQKIFTAVEEITGSSKVGVAAPLANDEGKRRKQMPNTFLIFNISEVHRQILIQQTVWASANITFRVTSPSLKLPTFMFAIKGFRTKDASLVQETIKEMWNDEITTGVIQEGMLNIKEEACERATQAIHAFLNSTWVIYLDTRTPGAILDPTFNVHMDGSILNDVRIWSGIRDHLMERDYHNNSLGRGRVIVAPYHCGLCHGVDHPRGMCPFPSITDWRGPKRRPQLDIPRKRAGNSALAKTFPDTWD